MVNFSKATLLFAIGYVTAIGITVILLPLQTSLRALIVFGIVQLIFTELHFVYLSKTKCEIENTLRTILKIGGFWAILSITLDFALFSVLVPLISGAGFDPGFFGTQPFWYWAQFPMMIITGLIARVTYLKVYKIQLEASQKEEVQIY